MTNIDEIRKRDREAIPRFGPDGDPLLRAEMDRRWLLAQVDSLTARCLDLIAQRREHIVKRTEAEAKVEEIQRSLAEVLGRVEAAKQAAREIMAERNTWARQLADMRDERNAAREETEKARELAAIASNDRDNLHIAMDTLAEGYARSHSSYSNGAAVANDIRREISRWETT